LSVVMQLGLAVYLAACGVGLAAAYGRLRFGVWHHRLYALVVATTIAAAVLEFHPALLLTLAVLAAFPRARPNTPYHPGLAAIGLLGYLGARPW
jgi:hypothetical protein